jgi:hypothetical protein
MTIAKLVCNIYNAKTPIKKLAHAEKLHMQPLSTRTQAQAPLASQ